MTNEPFISICIPAYKRVDYLKRLLGLISSQTYKNFEVVITDDSGNDNTVENFIKTSNFNFKILYVKNPVPLGSPLNWMESFKHANGEWIKIMHDDDGFASDEALASFISAIDSDTDCLFSGYIVQDEVNKSSSILSITKSAFLRFQKHPHRLFAKNVIGPPSVMLFKKTLTEQFDARLKWIVDWEFYIRLALKYNLKYINKALILVSYNDSQITNNCTLNPAVEIPEIMIFYTKYRDVLFKDIVLFDAWWRLIRNLRIRSKNDFAAHTNLELPKPILTIIMFQSIFPYHLLKIGIFSKMYMSICFLYSGVFNK